MINYSPNKEAVRYDSYCIGDIVRIKRGRDLFDTQIIACKCIYGAKAPYAYKVNVYRDNAKNWIEAEYIVGVVEPSGLRY